MTKQGSGQTGGPSAAVYAQFRTRKGADFEAGLAQTFIGFTVLFETEEAFAPQSKHVAGKRFTLRGINVDETVATAAQQFHCLNRQPRKVHQCSIFIEQADE